MNYHAKLQSIPESSQEASLQVLLVTPIASGIHSPHKVLAEQLLRSQESLQASRLVLHGTPQSKHRMAVMLMVI